MLAAPREVVAVLEGPGIQVHGLPLSASPSLYLPTLLPRPWQTLAGPTPVDLMRQYDDETVMSSPWEK